MRHVALFLLFAIGITCLTLSLTATVHADGPGSSAPGPTASAGSGDAAAQLSDPLEHPIDALDQAKLAQKTGWPMLVFAALVMLTKALAYGAVTLQTVPLIGVAATWLAKARNAMLVAAIGTVSAAGYNALIAGGSWVAALMAAGLAGAGLLSAYTHAKPPSLTQVGAGVAGAALALVIAAGFVTQPACGTTTGGSVVTTLLDCGKQDQTGIESAYNSMKSALESGGSWSSVAAAAGGAAISIVACALADLVQEHLSAKKAMPVDQSWAAHDALERVRAQLGGATIKSVRYGNL